MSRQFKYYDIILALFAGALLIPNLGAIKLIQFGPIIADGGAILFPLTYILGDVLTEIYGYKYARRAIWTGFFIMLLATLSFFLVGILPAAPEWHMQNEYSSVLGFFPRIVVASLMAYCVGEFLNSLVLAKLKVATNGKWLGLRLIGSTVVGDFLTRLYFRL